jgi:uncharacterized membrane protein YedE/YeeE
LLYFLVERILTLAKNKITIWLFFKHGLVFIRILITLHLIYFGKTFGMSSNLRSMCSMSGLGNGLVFFLIGIAALEFGRCCRCYAMVCCGSFHEWPFKCFHQPKTIDQLAKLGIDAPYGKLLPMRSLAIKYFNHLRIFWYCLLEDCWLVFLAVRRGGCTSGHAISGLSNLQIPSLMAVVVLLAD